MWVIVILHDGQGPRMEIFGDENGRPFMTQEAATTAADVYPRRGARYSVYVVQVQRG